MIPGHLQRCAPFRNLPVPGRSPTVGSLLGVAMATCAATPSTPTRRPQLSLNEEVLQAGPLLAVLEFCFNFLLFVFNFLLVVFI